MFEFSNEQGDLLGRKPATLVAVYFSRREMDLSVELVAYIAVAGIWKMLHFLPLGMHFLKLLMAVKNIRRRASNLLVATVNGFTIAC